MVLIRRYTHVRKPNNKGALTPLTAVRAVGLAVEELHKKSCNKGLSVLVESGEALRVQLTGSRQRGDLELLQDSVFRKASTCTLELAKKDADLAKKLAVKQRAYLLDLGANAWHPDRPLGRGLGSADLLCDLCPPAKLPVKGILQIELKVLSAWGFEKTLGALLKKDLPRHFAKVQQKHPEIQGLLLLASKVDHDGHGNWLEPKLVGKLFVNNAEGWQDISPSGKKVARGQKTVVKKHALPQVFSDMEWHLLPDGIEVGLFSQFLRKLKVAHCNPEQKAQTYNGMLRSAGVRGRILKKKIKNRPGKACWVGTREVLRAVYKYL